MRGRLLVGLVLVAVGVGLALDAAGQIEFGRLLGTYWPLLLVVVGAVQMIDGSGRRAGPFLLISVGASLLAYNLGVIHRQWVQYLGPAVLILVGLIILAPSGSRKGTSPETKGRFRRVAFLGGFDERFHGTFQGGEVNALLGGGKLDLREASLPPGGARLEASATMGGVEIIVPPSWQVELDAAPILGGVENKTSRPTASDAPVLRIRAVAVMGGVEIKN